MSRNTGSAANASPHTSPAHALRIRFFVAVSLLESLSLAFAANAWAVAVWKAMKFRQGPKPHHHQKMRTHTHALRHSPRPCCCWSPRRKPRHQCPRPRSCVWLLWMRSRASRRRPLPRQHRRRRLVRTRALRRSPWPCRRWSPSCGPCCRSCWPRPCVGPLSPCARSLRRRPRPWGCRQCRLPCTHASWRSLRFRLRWSPRPRLRP